MFTRFSRFATSALYLEQGSPNAHFFFAVKKLLDYPNISFVSCIVANIIMPNGKNQPRCFRTHLGRFLYSYSISHSTSVPSSWLHHVASIQLFFFVAMRQVWSKFALHRNNNRLVILLHSVCSFVFLVRVPSRRTCRSLLIQGLNHMLQRFHFFGHGVKVTRQFLNLCKHRQERLQRTPNRLHRFLD